MDLTPEEETVLAGGEGETRARMLEVLLALGKVFGADRLIPIRSAQISGASYKTIGEYGLEWLRSLDARVSVPAFLNPVGMDRDRWQEMGVDPAFARDQQDVIEAYARLGVRLSCTCTPYYFMQTDYGDHLAWSESSAVCFANSVIGARTNREGGPGALAAAIIGKTPCYGLHLVGNRRPHLVFRVEDAPPDADTAWYGALGYHAGKIAGNRIPFFQGIRPPRDGLKALGAAMAATGAVALFHVEGITPDARIFPFDTAGLEVVPVTSAEVSALFVPGEVDAVAIGCPHCSGDELSRIAGLLAGRQARIPLWIFASREVIAANRETVTQIEGSGARVFADTCMVVSPAMDRFSTIMVNSGKAAAYVPTMCGAAVRAGTLAECIATATSPV